MYAYISGEYIILCIRGRAYNDGYLVAADNDTITVTNDDSGESTYTIVTLGVIA